MSKCKGAGTASAESTKRSGYEAHRLTQHRYCSARDASLQNLKAFHNRSCSCSGAAHALHRCEETLSTMFVALICKTPLRTSCTVLSVPLRTSATRQNERRKSTSTRLHSICTEGILTHLQADYGPVPGPSPCEFLLLERNW